MTEQTYTIELLNLKTGGTITATRLTEFMVDVVVARYIEEPGLFEIENFYQDNLPLMTQRINIKPYDVSWNPDDRRFYLCDTRTEGGKAGIPLTKQDNTPAIFETWSGAVAHARKLLDMPGDNSSEVNMIAEQLDADCTVERESMASPTAGYPHSHD